MSLIHRYQNNGYNIVLDINSGCIHVVDEVTYEVLPYMEEECDRMEYDGSMMYDEYPDRLSLFRIADTISTILEQEAEKVSKDLIHVLVCNEIYKRRHGGRRGMIAFL